MKNIGFILLQYKVFTFFALTFFSVSITPDKLFANTLEQKKKNPEILHLLTKIDDAMDQVRVLMQSTYYSLSPTLSEGGSEGVGDMQVKAPKTLPLGVDILMWTQKSDFAHLQEKPQNKSNKNWKKIAWKPEFSLPVGLFPVTQNSEEYLSSRGLEFVEKCESLQLCNEKVVFQLEPIGTLAEGRVLAYYFNSAEKNQLILGVLNLQKIFEFYLKNLDQRERENALILSSDGLVLAHGLVGFLGTRVKWNVKKASHEKFKATSLTGLISQVEVKKLSGLPLYLAYEMPVSSFIAGDTNFAIKIGIFAAFLYVLAGLYFLLKPKINRSKNDIKFVLKEIEKEPKPISALPIVNTTPVESESGVEKSIPPAFNVSILESFVQSKDAKIQKKEIASQQMIQLMLSEKDAKKQALLFTKLVSNFVGGPVVLYRFHPLVSSCIAEVFSKMTPQKSSFKVSPFFLENLGQGIVTKDYSRIEKMKELSESILKHFGVSHFEAFGIGLFEKTPLETEYLRFYGVLVILQPGVQSLEARGFVNKLIEKFLQAKASQPDLMSHPMEGLDEKPSLSTLSESRINETTSEFAKRKTKPTVYKATRKN